MYLKKQTQKLSAFIGINYWGSTLYLLKSRQAHDVLLVDVLTK